MRKKESKTGFLPDILKMENGVFTRYFEKFLAIIVKIYSWFPKKKIENLLKVQLIANQIKIKYSNLTH